MNNDVATLALFFESGWQPMLDLMGRARSNEFRIRLAVELRSQATFSASRTWEEFKKGQRQVVRRKLERHIKEVFPECADQMILIRQCADGLAHADYRAARLRIDQYRARFGLMARTTDTPVGIMLYKNVRHEDGTNADMGYLLTSSEENLILEEYLVFEGQGYKQAAEELLSFAENELLKTAPRFAQKYAALVMSRGLKYGVRATANQKTTD